MTGMGHERSTKVIMSLNTFVLSMVLPRNSVSRDREWGLED